MSTRCHLWFLVCFFSILASTHKTIGLICPDGLIDYFCLQNDFLIVIEALQLAFCCDFFLCFFFHWSIVDLQCCANFCSTAKWLSCTHIYILFSYSFQLWFIPEHWTQMPVSYGRTLVFILSKYNSFHLIQTLSLHPSPSSLPLANTSLFPVSVGLFLFCRLVSFVPYFRFCI